MHVVIMGSQARSMVNFWPVLVKTLKEQGHKVTCFVPKTPDEADAKAVQTIRLEWGADVCELPLSRRGLNPFSDFASLLALRKEFLKLKPDVFFGYAIKPVIYGTLAAWLGKVPARFAMITGLGYTFEADSLPKKVLTKIAAFLYRTALKRSSGVFFQNRDDLDVFKKHKIISPYAGSDFVHMINGTGVDITRFAASSPVLSPLSFLLVGRLIEAKGIREYAEAAKLLKSKYPSAKFLLLGPPENGPGGVSLAEVKAWEEEGFIEYLGVTNDVRPFIKEASVMVLPSYREGLPCSIMEGMSMSRAAVVTSAPGCKEVVTEGENGFLVPVKNAVALAVAMEEFIKNPDLVRSMGMAGRARAETEFDASLVSKKLLQAMGLA